MKIGILSDCRVPTRAVGGHGLGRMAYDLALGLMARGHEVVLYAGHGSEFPGVLVTHADETERAQQLLHRHDAYVDLSHRKDLNQVHHDWHILNYIVDGECPYQPPNAAYPTVTDRDLLNPKAKVTPMGIDVTSIPFVEQPKRDYLAFAAKVIAHKGFHLALEIAERQTIPVKFAGERFVNAALPDWQPGYEGAAFYHYLGQALGLLQVVIHGVGGGRVQLEAAACGTPTLCFDWISSRDHVAHCLSGFWCQDVNEMLDAIPDLGLLDRRAMRGWVRETHDSSVMAAGVEQLLIQIKDGETW